MNLLLGRVAPGRQMPASLRLFFLSDERSASALPDLLAVADRAVQRAHDVPANIDTATYRTLVCAAERALRAATVAAAAAHRHAAGPRAYGDRFAWRKAQAKPEVMRWKRLVHELRARRERLILDALCRPGVFPPAAYRPNGTSALRPDIPGMQPIGAPVYQDRRDHWMGNARRRMIELAEPSRRHLG